MHSFLRRIASISASESSAAVAPSPQRIASIDAFRGFVIMTMVFVNHLAGMRNIPAWMEHMPDGAEGMTFVDVVFPAFIFIVGMVIPVAFDRRRARGESVARLLLHAVVRVAGLVAVGVLLVNTGFFSPENTGMNQNQWTLLIYAGVILAFIEARKFPRAWGIALHVAGFAILATAAATFRGKQGEWLHTSWWGILGLIGWAYMTGTICYALCRRNTTGLLGCVAMLLVIYEAGVAGGLSVLDPLRSFFNFPELMGSQGSIAVAGTLAGVWVTDTFLSPKDKFSRLLIFGLCLLAAGHLMRSVHGFNKNNATESWALASAGYTLLTFSLFFAAMDWRGWRRWAAFLRPAGANPLMAYILPGIIVYGLIEIGAGKVLSIAHSGVLGILHALVFSGIVLAITAGLNRLNVIIRF